MEQNQRASSSSLRSYQFHPAKPVITDLFNLYLGRSGRQKHDEAARDPPNKAQKRITAFNRQLPPNDQFVSDFEQILRQYPDQEQLRLVTENVLISLIVQCSSHSPQAEFLQFSMRSLCSISYINWDTFLPSLLNAVSSAEMALGQGSQGTTSNIASQPGLLPSTSALPISSTFHSNPASPLTSAQGIGSPAQSANDPSPALNLSPLKLNEVSSNPPLLSLKADSSTRDCAISSLRLLCCKIILTGLDFSLKPVTYVEILHHMLAWLVNWDQRHQDIDDANVAKFWRPVKLLSEWLHSCLDVVWLLVKEDKCRVPFYELLRSDLQFIENIPDDDSLFTLIMEIHRRRDMMAMHMQMLDHQLHCPTFGTQRFLPQATPHLGSEAATNLRYSPITYPSVLGEPLHGEELASCIQKGSLDWDRALRCIRHALRTTPSPDWWKRVLLVASCYRPQSIVSTPGAVFTCEMICEATIDRIVELLKLTNSGKSLYLFLQCLLDVNCWQEWLIFSDIFFFLMKSGCIDFVDFVDKLVSRIIEDDQSILRTNHVTWLLGQIIRVELVMNALNTDSRKVETTRKLLSFHREEKSSDPRSAQSERMLDYMNMDDRSVGMFWVVSYTMTQPACEMVMNWLNSAGTEVLQVSNLQPNERLVVMRETTPLSISLLSGFSIKLCMKLAYQMEESLFSGQVIPSISMVETYARLLLIAPHSLFRSHFSHLTQRNPGTLSKPVVTLLVLEILNYRLLPLYRFGTTLDACQQWFCRFAGDWGGEVSYEGKNKSLMYDVTKIVAALKGKRGEHRVFRLAENLCINLILSLRDFFSVKKEGKGPTEFTETLNRIAIVSLAIIIKTRGIAEAEHLLYLPAMVEQILSSSQHTWSDKTLRYFPPVLRDTLVGRVDKRGLAIQAWQQAETTVINQCTQLLSPSADPTYVVTYISHSFPQHRQYLCAGAWILMHGHPENINSANLARVLREFSPEEVTANIYTMVDVLLHQIHVELQRGHPLQDLLTKASANLAFFVWTHELLPLDILVLALIDRDDDLHALHIVISLFERQELHQRMRLFFMTRGPPEHWLHTGIFKRMDLQKALGNYLSWKDRFPVFFDDIAARLLPVIPLVVYRLIENDATDLAERVLANYKQLLAYHPLRFTFVRDILAYFYGLLPGKLIVRILHVLDIPKIPFSESFPQHIAPSNSATCPPPDYFASLLLGLVNNVIPPLSSSSKTGSLIDSSHLTARGPLNKTPATSQSGTTSASDAQKAFYQIQDPGTYTQLVLETAVIELLSLPVSAAQSVASLVQVVVHIQPTLIQSSNGLHGTSNVSGQTSVLPTSPSGGSTDSMNASRPTAPVSGLNTSNFVSRSGYTCQQLSCLLIQACGLLLAQLPQDFHVQLYLEVARLIKESWWLSDGKRSPSELDSTVNYALLDPTWAAQDNTSTATGNIVGLIHSFFSNLPQEWLEGAHVIVKQLRPVTSVAMLRIVFRIMGPLLPRLANAHTLFTKTLSLLLGAIVDVFGKTAQPLVPAQASEIVDIIDFLHHVIHYEGQGGPVQSTSKPRAEVLVLFSRALENLRPDVQHLLSHLTTDVNSSIYAATHPKMLLMVSWRFAALVLTGMTYQEADTPPSFITVMNNKARRSSRRII
ncbi:hypothetical protein KSS87_007861 [Heliosperma pusillum]|nr:hypothetical protein KSS87_007861 [Heliosperma pusillum]